MKEKFKSYSFWVGLVTCIMLVIKFIAENFGFKIDEDAINNIINGVLGLLVILGVVNKPNNKSDLLSSSEENESIDDNVKSSENNEINSEISEDNDIISKNSKDDDKIN